MTISSAPPRVPIKFCRLYKYSSRSLGSRENRPSLTCLPRCIPGPACRGQDAGRRRQHWKQEPTCPRNHRKTDCDKCQTLQSLAKEHANSRCQQCPLEQGCCLATPSAEIYSRVQRPKGLVAGTPWLCACRRKASVYAVWQPRPPSKLRNSLGCCALASAQQPQPARVPQLGEGHVPVESRKNCRCCGLGPTLLRPSLEEARRGRCRQRQAWETLYRQRPRRGLRVGARLVSTGVLHSHLLQNKSFRE